MATEVKLRRDVEGDIDAMTPAEGEPIYDITNKRLRVGDGSTAGGLHLGAAADIQKQTFTYALVTGTDTLTASLSPGVASYVTGLQALIEIVNNNTGAVTINFDSLGAKTIKKNGGADDLVADDFIAGGIYAIAYDGVNFQFLGSASPGGELTSVQVFTASGTWTRPAGIKKIIVECIAGGGGGGATTTNASNESSCAGGGGGGGYARELLTSLASSETVTVGGGGNGGAVGGNAGVAGVSSSFGSLLSATAGAGGAGSVNSTGSVFNAGGAGGAGADGTFNLQGDDGGNGVVIAAIRTASGFGGSTHLSAIQAASVAVSGTGVAGKNYGGGGSGASAGNSAGSQVGGNGAGGIVIVWEYS